MLSEYLQLNGFICEYADNGKVATEIVMRIFLSPSVKDHQCFEENKSVDSAIKQASVDWNYFQIVFM